MPWLLSWTTLALLLPSCLAVKPKPPTAKICRSADACLDLGPGLYTTDFLSSQGLLRSIYSVEIPPTLAIRFRDWSEAGDEVWTLASPGCSRNSICQAVEEMVIEEGTWYSPGMGQIMLARRLGETIWQRRPGRDAASSRLDGPALLSQGDVHRLHHFEQNIRLWHGPISLVLYITHERDLDVLAAYFDEEHLALYDRVHLTIVKPDYSGRAVVERVTYPINRLRNLAWDNVEASHGLVIDADFVITESLSQDLEQVWRKVGGRETALVVPALALADINLALPKTKEELRKYLSNNLVYITDPGAGHGPTRLDMFSSNGFSPYYETCYESQWEPYYMIDKSAPRYDERFTNQGGDKQSHALTLNAKRFRFVVLNTDSGFVLHLPHPSTEPTRETKHTFPRQKDRLNGADTGSWMSKLGTEFTYFDHFLPTLQKNYYYDIRWPRRCSAWAVAERLQDRNLRGIAGSL